MEAENATYGGGSPSSCASHHVPNWHVSWYHVTPRESSAQDSPKFQIDPTPDALIPSRPRTHPAIQRASKIRRVTTSEDMDLYHSVHGHDVSTFDIQDTRSHDPFHIRFLTV